MVEKARKEVEVEVKEAGEQAVIEAGTPGLHPEIVKTLGRLKYRYSYGQNQLKHAVETANLAAMIAHELGANVEIARRGGLLHDLGKAIDHDVEGTHAVIGANLARRFRCPRQRSTLHRSPPRGSGAVLRRGGADHRGRRRQRQPPGSQT